MAKSSEIKEAYSALSVMGAKKAIVYIMEELSRDADAIVLESSSSDPKLSEKLMRSQERRFLLNLLKTEIK